ncbi:MAG: conjugal transfer protein TrbL [Candidatus Nanopelagicales bacterium]
MISTVCDTAGEAAASLVSAPFDWLAQAMGGAAGWLFEAVWSVFDTTTLVDVQRPGFVSVFNLVFGIAVFVMLLFFALQLITGMIRRDPTALTRAALGLGKSVLGSFVVITLVALLLEITDQLCVGIIQAAGETTETMGDKIAALVLALSGLSIAAPGVGAIIMIFLAGLAIASAAIVWLSLLIRKSLLLVAVALAPLAFSGSSWDAARGWVGKWAMFVIALILSKLVLVVIFLVAITQVAAPIDVDLASVSDPLSGIVLMALAGFAPYLTYRFLAFVGTDYYGQAGAEDDAKRALNRPIPVPSKPSGDGPKKVLDGQTSGDGGGSGGGAGAPPKPTPTASGAGGAGAGASGSAGASAGAGAGAGAAAAGPAAAVVVGAQVVKGAATAGPKAGTALAGEAETAAAGAGQASAPPPPSTPAPTAPPSPRPAAPTPPKPTKE